jgi:hypothetical protein
MGRLAKTLACSLTVAVLFFATKTRKEDARCRQAGADREGICNFVGLDLGQKRDFSAVAVVEREERMAAGWSPRPSGVLTVRHLERMPLGTSYMRVMERVKAIMQNPQMAGQSRLVVDATGLGAPVVDMLQGAGLGSRMTAVTITAGEEARGSDERWSVPKRDLLSGVEVLLERGELVISRQLRDAETLVRELEGMRLAGTGRGKLLEEGSEHDDLVLALTLACWRARRARNGFGTCRLPGI